MATRHSMLQAEMQPQQVKTESTSQVTVRAGRLWSLRQKGEQGWQEAYLPYDTVASLPYD